MNDESEYSKSPRKRRRISISRDGSSTQNHTGSSPMTSFFKDHGGTSARFAVTQPSIRLDADKNASMSASPRLVGQTVAPFLARHAPTQYAPLGEPHKAKPPNATQPENPNTKYCYRHRPDLKCRRQADEPSMDQLQHVRWCLFIEIIR